MSDPGKKESPLSDVQFNENSEKGKKKDDGLPPINYFRLVSLMEPCFHNRL